MARTPSGTITSVATVLATAKNVTAITNAAEAVCSSTAHGLTTGDVVIVTSGWPKLNRRSLRVKATTTDAFTLEGFDTSNASLFPAGAGVGSVQKVTTFVELDNTTNHNAAGGEAKTATFSFIEHDQDMVVPDGQTAVQRTFDMDADQIGTAGYAALKTLSDTQALTVMRRRAKTGATTLITGTVFFSEEETGAQGGLVAVKATFFAKSTSTRYAA